MKEIMRLIVALMLLAGMNSYAQLDAGVVVFYLKNLPYERIGSESDQEIISKLEAEGYKVISVDCSEYPKTSPQLEEALTVFHKNSPALLSEFYTQTQISNLDVFYVPEGYTLKKHIPVWNIKEHGAEGSLERIMDTYNNEIVSKTKYGRIPVSSPDEMIDKKGNPLDYNLYMHIVCPSGTASKKVPTVINFASSSQMQKGFNPVKSKESTVYRTLFPLGFLTSGYAWVHVDHPYNPLARDHVYEYFDRYSLEDWNGLNAARAYVRYLRTFADELNLNGKFGAMGVSKASYSTVRITSINNANEEERNLFNNTSNTKPQPWEGVPSTIDVAWAAAGTGTMRIASYANHSTVPMATSAGLTDQYGHWNLYPSVVTHFTSNKLNHLPFWMEDLGHDYPCMGEDLATGENRYFLLKRYFDHYLKPTSSIDSLEVFYIFPRENAAEITNKGYSRILTSDDILPENMQGVSPYAPITIRFLSEVNIQEVKSKVNVMHKSTKAPVIGTWTESVPNMVFEFVPDGDLLKNNEYEVVIQVGLRAINGQVLIVEKRRSFTIDTFVAVPEEEKYRVFFDDFERSALNPGGTPQIHYTVSNKIISGPAPATPSITGFTSTPPKGRIRLWNNQKTNSGRAFVSGELSAYSAPSLLRLNQLEADSVVWSFNFRHTTDAYFTSSASGFGPDQSGFATVLLATDADIEVASGYAIVVGDANYGRRYRLVKFINGLNDNSKLENVFSSESEMAGIGSGNYHAMKIVYIPQANIWKLYCKPKEELDMAASSMPLVGMGIDDTLVDSDMTHFGFLNNYYTTSNADRMVHWDNYSVRVMESRCVLKDLKVNQESIEFFRSDKYEYVYHLPYDYPLEDIPEVIAIRNTALQKIEVVSAKNLSGSESERTTFVNVTENNTSAQYRVVFEILPKLDIFLCLGQSNMSGYGEILEDDKGVIDNTFLFTPGKRFEYAENPLNKHSTITNSVFKISPAYGFAKELLNKTENPVGLIVNARNGASMKDWGKGNTETKLYENTIERAIEAKRWGEIRGVVWHQGESDSWQYAKYPELISDWVQNFRTDVGDINNDIYFVAGELAYWRSSGTSQPFNDLLHSIATYVPNSDWVSAADLIPWKDTTDPHFSRESAIELGVRYAEKIVGKFYASSSIHVSRTEDITWIAENKRLQVINAPENSSLALFNLLGQCLFNKKISQHESVLLEKGGVYILALTLPEGNKMTKRIIVK